MEGLLFANILVPLPIELQVKQILTCLHHDICNQLGCSAEIEICAGRLARGGCQDHQALDMDSVRQDSYENSE